MGHLKQSFPTSLDVSFRAIQRALPIRVRCLQPGPRGANEDQLENVSTSGEPHLKFALAAENTSIMFKIRTRSWLSPGCRDLNVFRPQGHTVSNRHFLVSNDASS